MHLTRLRVPAVVRVFAWALVGLDWCLQVFRYLPAGDGVVTVSSDDPFLSENVDITLNEHSDNVLVLTALMHKTGKPLIVETVTVVDNLRRVRTVQVQGRNFVNYQHSTLTALHQLSRASSVLFWG